MSTTYSTRNAWASGLMLFAAAMLLTVGLFQILQAIAALANDDIVIRGPEDLPLRPHDLGMGAPAHRGRPDGCEGAFLFTGARVGPMGRERGGWPWP